MTNSIANVISELERRKQDAEKIGAMLIASYINIDEILEKLRACNIEPVPACDDCTYKRFAANMKNAEARDNQMREKWERERDTEELAPFVKRKMAQAREDVLKNVCICNFDILHLGINEGTIEHVCERTSCIHVNEPWVLCKVVGRPTPMRSEVMK